jgi:hypothetical protein
MRSVATVPMSPGLSTSATRSSPVDRLARPAIASAEAIHRDQRPDAVTRAVRQGLREAIFRFELVPLRQGRLEFPSARAYRYGCVPSASREHTVSDSDQAKAFGGMTGVGTTIGRISIGRRDEWVVAAEMRSA